MEKRDALKVWTVLLAILTFSLSLMGTFLVRSGILTSVHAFAVDPKRGVFVLAIMTLFTGGALALFALRARDLRQGGIFAPISREGALVLNNILLTTACATVLVGTLYPLVLESLTGDKISVGPPYFDWTFGPLMVPLLLALPFGPFLAWKRGDAYAAAQRLAFAALAALIFMALAWSVMHRGPVLAPFGLALGVFAMAGAVSDIAWRIRLGSVPLDEAWRRLLGLPRSAVGSALAHFGVGMLVVGVVATSAYREEKILVMKPGEQVAIAGYDIAFRGVAPGTGPNYREESGIFDVTRGGSAVTRLEPGRRIYDMPPEPTTEAGIHVSWRGDLYVVLGDAQTAGGYAVRVYFNPLVRFIWLGALVMFFAGAISLSDRRLRVGAPGRARRIAAAPAE
jgi:cytochrome c-type biogenesis protein CcmF